MFEFRERAGSIITEFIHKIYVFFTETIADVVVVEPHWHLHIMLHGAVSEQWEIKSTPIVMHQPKIFVGQQCIKYGFEALFFVFSIPGYFLNRFPVVLNPKAGP